MRTAICTAVLLTALSALPALAADAQPAMPASPPLVSYDVWGFQWDGRQFVKQATHSFSTTDLKQAADYSAQLTSFPDWAATSNLPDPCVVHTVYHGRRATKTQPTDFPAKPSFSVWAYQLTDGKWVKDDKYSWTTPDPVAGLEYAKKVNAVAGWRATTNCPPPVPEAQRVVDGGILHGPQPRNSSNRSGGVLTINLGGVTFQIPRQMLQGVGRSSFSSDSSSSFAPTYGDDSAVQNMISTQDMINNQTMNDNMQEMLDTQNNFNTQNMIDSQNAINAQNGP
jgi:hypothetical protein